MTRFLFAVLGLAMILIGVLWLAARGIARSFAPRVIIVEKSSEQRPSQSFPLTRAVILFVGLMLLVALFRHAGPR